jgi:hypothetical protein
MNSLGNAVPHTPNDCQVGDMIVDELSVLWKVSRLDANSSMVDVQRADNHMRTSQIDLNDVQQVYRPRRMVTSDQDTRRFRGTWAGVGKRVWATNEARLGDGSLDGGRTIRTMTKQNHTDIECDYDCRCSVSLAPMHHASLWVATARLGGVHGEVLVPMARRPLERIHTLCGKAVAGGVHLTMELRFVDDDTVHMNSWLTQRGGMKSSFVTGELVKRGGA